MNWKLNERGQFVAALLVIFLLVLSMGIAGGNDVKSLKQNDNWSIANE